MNGLDVYQVPCRIWVSPRFDREWRDLLARRVRLSAQVRVLDSGGTWVGPAILLLTAEDIGTRPDLTELVEMAAPARPIVVGGTEHRDLLLAALNDLRAFRVLRRDATIDEVIEALRASHERLELDATLDMQVGRLRSETERLDLALAEVSDAHHEFLHAERLSTIGRLFSGLLGAVRQHAAVMDHLNTVAHDAALPDEAGLLVRNASEASGTIFRLLDELERFARGGDDGGGAFRPEPIDAVVQQVHEFARFDELSRGRTILTRLVSDATVRADRYALYQVLLNLVRNALQATRTGGLVELHTRVEGDSVLIEVLDNGAGVPAELRPRLFEGFVSTRGADGTGLGLQNARRVVEQHGGTLSYSDRAGDGSRFIVRLPCAS